MYEDYEGPTSLYLAFKGALKIATIIAFSYLVTYF